MNPIASFLRKNVLLLILTALAVAAVLNDWLFTHLGSLLYIPAACGVWSLVWRLCISLRFSATIDADSHVPAGGEFSREVVDWQALTPAERTLNRTLIKVGIGIALALVAASVGK